MFVNKLLSILKTIYALPDKWWFFRASKISKLFSNWHNYKVHFKLFVHVHAWMFHKIFIYTRLLVLPILISADVFHDSHWFEFLYRSAWSWRYQRLVQRRPKWVISARSTVRSKWEEEVGIGLLFGLYQWHQSWHRIHSFTTVSSKCRFIALSIRQS